MTDLTDESVKAMLNLLRSETEAASRTDAADMIEALHAELAQARADAKAAVGVVVERAAALIEGTAYTSNGDKRSLEPVGLGLVGMDMHHATIAAAIRTIAPEDAIAEVAKLRAELDEWRAVSETLSEMSGNAEAERDRLAAELAAAIAREAGLRDALGDMVDLFSADNVLRKGTHLNATLKLARIALAQPGTEGGE